MLRSAIFVLILGLLTNQGYSQGATQRGTVIGGATGGVIGGIIGNQNDNTGKGALIGTAVGAIAGSLLGNAKDQQYYEAQRQNAIYHQQVRQREYQAQQLGRAVSMQDVIALSQSGVSNSVIINQIQVNGVRGHLSVSDVIEMHRHGVSEVVMNAMQKGRIAGSVPRTNPVVIQETPVIVHETPRCNPRPPVMIERLEVIRPTPYLLPHAASRHYHYRSFHRHH